MSAALQTPFVAFEPAVAGAGRNGHQGDPLVAQQWAGTALIVVAAADSLGPREWMHRMGRANSEIMADPIVAALARVPLFRGLSPHDLATLATVTTMRPLDAGTVLTTEGEVGDEFFIIERGVVAIGARDQQLRTLGSGDFLGEIAIVFGGARTATAVATEPGTLLVLPKADFLELLAANPAIEDKILITASERVRYG